ncbi:hypothetical protein AX14_013564 [Amanita brunnescens Koide BX004]|nr:hypothetical protein AX14_013564 [Amanita brunnescens Koide BX004]
MASSSYADFLYAKSRYAYMAFDASGCVDSSADFSLAMLDMTNDDFEVDYATICSADELMAYYLGPEDPDTRVYNAKFLKRLAQDFPQYKRVIDAANPYESGCVKDTYSTIALPEKQDHFARQAGSSKNNPDSRAAQARLVSVFSGSYDEQHEPHVLKGDSLSYKVSEPSFEASTSHPANVLCHDDSDSDYDDRRITKSFRRGSRCTSFPASSASLARSDNDHVPALCLDEASSPESFSIETPTLSPMMKTFDIDGTEATILEIHDPNLLPGTSKDSVSTPGYTIISSELIVASWGSNMGKCCHPIPGGYECSCGHRTGTMGDMTRHWQSKRHSEAAFECKGCGKVYTREDALKRHMRRNDECARKARQIALSL